MLKGLFKGTGKTQRVGDTPLRRVLRQRLTVMQREVGQRWPIVQPMVLALGGKAMQYLESLSDADLKQLVTVLHEEAGRLYDIAINGDA